MSGEPINESEKPTIDSGEPIDELIDNCYKKCYATPVYIEYLSFVRSINLWRNEDAI